MLPISSRPQCVNREYIVTGRIWRYRHFRRTTTKIWCNVSITYTSIHPSHEHILFHTTCHNHGPFLVDNLQIDHRVSVDQWLIHFKIPDSETLRQIWFSQGSYICIDTSNDPYIFVGLILMLCYSEAHIHPRRNRWIIVDPAGIELIMLTTSRLGQHRHLPAVQHVRFMPLKLCL